MDKCGTVAGYAQHRRDGEETCGLCRAAFASYQADRRKSGAASKQYTCQQCGTEWLSVNYPTSGLCRSCVNRRNGETGRAKGRAPKPRPPCKTCGRPLPKLNGAYCSRPCYEEGVGDRRGPLRRAIENGNGTAVIAIIREDCIQTSGGCWEWQRKTRARSGGKPYAEIRIARKSYAVHRLTAAARYGISDNTPVVHHKCANTIYVNPDHLQPVTNRENIAEMLERNYYLARIAELESALAAVAPEHALIQVSDVA